MAPRRRRRRGPPLAHPCASARVLGRYLNFPANDADVNDQAIKEREELAKRIESERTAKAKQQAYSMDAVFSRPCNPVNVRRITRDTDRVRSAPRLGPYGTIAYPRIVLPLPPISPLCVYAIEKTHSMKQVVDVFECKEKTERMIGSLALK